MSDTYQFLVQSAIGNINIDCSIEESHVDTLTITEHPVEQGADITDHAFLNPPKCTLRAGWSNASDMSEGDSNYISDIYDALLALQQTRQTFDVITLKRYYPNMLIESLSTTTDDTTSSSLMIIAQLKAIIQVQTQVVTMAPATSQASPQSTAAPVQSGTAQPAPTSITPAYATK